jgi:hypothetical protein
MRGIQRSVLVCGAVAVACCVLAGGAGAAAGAAPAAGNTWGSARELPGFTALNRGGIAEATSVSCPSAGNCGLGGSYYDASRVAQAFVADEKAGTWHAAKEVPGTSALNTGSAGVTSVSCASAGNCGAGGDYLSAAGTSQAFVANEVNGTWHTAHPLGETVSVGSGPGSEVTSVSCAAAGSCTAGGYYEDIEGGQQAFVADEKNGTWQTAIEVPGTGALNVNVTASVTAVSCASPGDCGAGGYYTDGSGHTQAFVVTETSGVWGTAKETAAALNTGGNATVNSVSCPSAGNCAAGGSYRDGSGHTEAFVVTETSGSWGTARETADALNTGGNATVNSVSCPSAGNCAAGGSYRDGAGHAQSALITVSVRARYSGTPAGTVTVKAGAATLCAIALAAGKGSCGLTPRELRRGTYHVTARYPGSRDFLGSVSAAATLTVT